jgi:hypothetical protein
MKNLIKVKYQFKDYSNSTLFKFFKTQEEVNSFKLKNPNYVFIGEK